MWRIIDCKLCMYLVHIACPSITHACMYTSCTYGTYRSSASDTHEQNKCHAFYLVIIKSRANWLACVCATLCLSSNMFYNYCQHRMYNFALISQTSTSLTCNSTHEMTATRTSCLISDRFQPNNMVCECISTIVVINIHC